MPSWHPHVTVAAIIEKNNKFLMVEEDFEGYKVFNQPAGHLDADESLLASVSREVLSESGWHFTPEYLVGIYQYIDLYTHVTYIRFSFGGQLGHHEENHILELQIESVVWLTKEQLLDKKLKNPIVIRSVNDYQNGRRIPLDSLTCF